MIATKRGLERETEELSSKPGEGRPGPRTSDATATRATEKGVDGEREFRSGGGALARRGERAGNGSHHALLRSPGTRGVGTWGARQWWQPSGRAERARDKVRINKGGKRGGARPAIRTNR